MITVVKKIFKVPINFLGYDIKKKDNPIKNENYTPPKLFNDKLEALHYVRGGTPAAFHCPIHDCVHRIGLNFAKRAWHPFVEALKEYELDDQLRYEDSSLKKYYDNWQPESAADAVVDFKNTSKKFETLPPHLFYLTPWSSLTIERVDRAIRKWHKEDDSEHGEPNLNMEEHGFRDFGPVTLAKGRLEFKRLINIYRSIKESGFDRIHGDIEVLGLKRGSEYRFINKGGGYHRTAAMVSLGYDEIPARFTNPWFMSIDDIDYWPQVRNGVWNRNDAERYFHHLFDFDSLHWAKVNKLTE